MEFLDVEIEFTSAVILSVLVTVLVVLMLRVLFHSLPLVPGIVPESGFLILLGLAVGGIMFATDSYAFVTQEVSTVLVFSVLLPFVVLPDAYTLDTKTFFSRWEFALVLLHAMIGTIISALLTGTFLWLCSEAFLHPLPLIDAFIFGSLISATDPVAVLSIFEQVHVNERLTIVVSGESTLNDAAGITLYGFFLALKASLQPGEVVTAAIVWEAIGQFLVIALGGSAFGLVLGTIGSVLSRWTGIVAITEPFVVVSMCWISYLLADWVGMSGILGLFSCAVMFRFFLDRNVREGSRIGTNSLVRLLGMIAETVIFIWLGATSLFFFLKTDPATGDWDGAMIGCTFAIILPLRFLLVFSINSLTNLCRRKRDRFPVSDSFLQAYSGLRGPVAFALAYTLPTTVASRIPLITTTLIVVWGTVFIVGTTAKPLIKCLKVKPAGKIDCTRELHPTNRLSRFFMWLLLRPDFEAERTLSESLVARRKVTVSLDAVNIRRVRVIERLGSGRVQLQGSSKSDFLSTKVDDDLLDDIDSLGLQTKDHLTEDDFQSVEMATLS